MQPDFNFDKKNNLHDGSVLCRCVKDGMALIFCL